MLFFGKSKKRCTDEVDYTWEESHASVKYVIERIDQIRSELKEESDRTRVVIDAIQEHLGIRINPYQLKAKVDVFEKEKQNLK